MVRCSRTFRLTCWLASTGLVAASILGGIPVRAQDSPGDPPARVGRLARLDGSVSLRNAGDAQWTPAVLNFPFASGQSLWTQPGAQADVEIGADSATLADSTELDLSSLDDRSLVASEPRGAVFLELRDVQPGDTYTINTQRGAAQIAANGEYEILAGDADTPTRVVVVRGAAQLTSGTLALRAGPGQMAVASGTQDIQGEIEPLPGYDPFLTAMLARHRAAAQLPPAVQGMTGAASLAQYGTWQDTPQYGQVWYPQVAPGWVPYRDGSWSYVEPWGWTWVDNEPWGFAPFHYGRWAQRDDRWCWVPGEAGVPPPPRPVYAPALVDFVVAGAVAGAAAGLLAASLSSGRGDVGWVPLGPREAYIPPYGGSARYRDRLNWGPGWHRPQWGNDTRISNTQISNTTNNYFINQRAVTIAPAAAMAHSQQIRPIARGFDHAASRGFQPGAVQPLRGPLPIRPVAQTRGLTPQAARRFGISGEAGRPMAPGPGGHPGMQAGFGHAINPTPGHPSPDHPTFGRMSGPPPTRPMAAGPAMQRAATPHAAPLAPPLREHPPMGAGPARPGMRPAESAHPPAMPYRTEPRGEAAPRLEPARRPEFRPEPRSAMPRMESPRAMPQRMEAPRAMPPHMEAPRAMPPRMEAPRAMPPRMEAPGPAPRPEPPHGQPGRPQHP